MKHWGIIFFSVALTVVVGCSHKKAQEPLKFDQPANANQPAIDTNTYVPFTRDLYNKLRAYNIDLRKVQFFVDQQLVLSRFMDMNKAEVTSGVVKFLNGKYINEIVIPAYTPCVCDSVDVDGLRVSFEKGNNSFKFINNKYSPDFFIFSGNNWKDGTCEVMYDKIPYRASCGSCGSAADVKLVVKQSDIDKSDKKTKTLQGRRVD